MTQLREALPRVTIKLKDIKPNPFRQYIGDGKLDEAKVKELEDSVRDLDFWDNVLVRKAGSDYQLVYGHKRVQAAIRQLGGNSTTSCAVIPYEDADMIRGMAKENATGEQESIKAQVDYIKLVRQFIRDNPTCCHSCKQSLLPGNKNLKGGPPHKTAGETCVVTFLKDNKNWSQTKVHELFTLGAGDIEAVKLTSDVLQYMENGYGLPEPGSIGLKVGLALGRLATPAAQKSAAAAIRAEQKKGDKGIYVPKSVVERVVQEVVELPPAKQAAEVVKRLSEEIETLKQTAEDRKLEKSWKKKNKSTGKPKPKSKNTDWDDEPISAKEKAIWEQLLADIKKAEAQSKPLSLALPSDILAVVSEVIEAGYKTLARQRHPDVKGGTNEDMQKLNVATAWLRTILAKEKKK